MTERAIENQQEHGENSKHQPQRLIILILSCGLRPRASHVALTTQAFHDEELEFPEPPAGWEEELPPLNDTDRGVTEEEYAALLADLRQVPMDVQMQLCPTVLCVCAVLCSISGDRGGEWREDSNLGQFRGL